MNAGIFVKFLIYTHATFGGIALITGLVALIAKKGSVLHKRFGKIFFYAMLTSAVMALIISFLPDHESPFLFAIGVFSSYFLLSGYRSLRYKGKNFNLKTDKVLSLILLLTSIFMIVYPLLSEGSLNTVLTVFGAFGIVFSFRDIRRYRDLANLRSSWLKLHLSKMIGGYIAATTAFVIVNDFFPSYYGWFIPGAIGGVYIVFWMNKLNRKAAAARSVEA